MAFISYRTTYAAAHAVTVQYNGTPGTATRLSTSRPSLARTVPGAGRHVIPLRSFAHPVAAALSSLPGTSNVSLDRTEGSVLHNFDGLSDADQAAVNGGKGVGEDTPPTRAYVSVTILACP